MRPFHVDGIMLFRNRLSGREKILARTHAVFGGDQPMYFWMGKRGIFTILIDDEVDSLRQAMIQSAWIPRRRPPPPSQDVIWEVVDELTCNPSDLHRIGSDTWTRCDLILHFPRIAFDPTKWTAISPEKLSERLRNRELKKLVRAVEETRIRLKRGEYEFEDDVDPTKISTKKLHRLCNDKINFRYLKHKLMNPENSIMLAVRRVRPCVEPDCMYSRKKRTCILPTPYNVYRRLRAAGVQHVDYPVFKEHLRSLPDATTEMCRLLDTVSHPHVGGVCIYKKTAVSVTILILCSDRAVGGSMLKHIIQKYGADRAIYINEPLPDVVGFYKKHSFIWFDDHNMIYEP